ncbi:hypothetical protein C0J52_22512 [Blattella germanica]|nr:hypothetical protein C0J52_22512 [Blattella germanica]
MEDPAGKMRRDRGMNFTVIEKQIVIELIDKYKSIIENKKSDGVSVRQKEKAWADLCAEFNANLEVNNRTVKQIRQYYDNLKRSAKKAVSDDKLERFRTGGGVFKPSVDDDTAKLVAIIQDQVEPLQNPFDSNAEYNGDILVLGSELEVESETAGAAAATTTEIEESMAEENICGLLETSIATDDVPYLNRTPSSSAPLKKKRLTEATRCKRNFAELAEANRTICETENELLINKY